MEKLSYRIFISILIFSPLAFGTVEPWSILIMEGGVLLALLLFLVSKSRRREPLLKVPGTLPLFLLLGYMVLQIIPLPATLVRIVSPETWSIYQNTIGVFQPVTWISLSIDRHETLLELFRYITYIAAYILSVQLFSSKDYLKPAVNTIIVFATILAIASIIEHYTVSGKVFWFRNYNGLDGFGPYVNRNHYAGFAGMVLPLMVAMFLYLRPSLRYTSFRERVLEFFSHPRSHPYMLIGVSAIILAASIFISLSRGGIVSACISVGLLGVILAGLNHTPKAGITFALLCAIVLGSVGWFGWDPIFDRFDSIRNDDGNIEEQRVLVWKDSLRIIRDFPVTGTGFGTFKRIYPAYRTIPEGAVYSRAHNDYIESATDGGLFGVLIVGWFMVVTIWTSFKTIIKRRDPYQRHLFWGAFGGLLYMLLHSFVDFNLHIGANGLLFSVLIGVLVSAAHTRQHSRTEQSYLPVIRKHAGPVTVGATCLVLVITLLATAGGVSSKHIFQTLLPELFNEDLSMAVAESAIEKLQRASLYSPFNYLFQLTSGDISYQDLNDKARALSFYKKAVQLSPSSSYPLQKLAISYTGIEQDGIAEGLYKASIKYAVMSPDAQKEYALWLFDKGRIDDGISHIRHAIELAPTRAVEYLDLLAEKGIEEPILSRALPDRVQPHLAYAKQLIKNGKPKAAETAFEKALQFMNKEEKVQAGYFIDVSSFYDTAGRYQDALRIIRTAVSYLPDDPAIRLNAAQLYEKCDIPYRAVEEYEKVILLDPGNTTAKKRLTALHGDG